MMKLILSNGSVGVAPLKRTARFVAVLLVLALAGCVGGKVPTEKVLRITSPERNGSSIVSLEQKAVVLQQLEAFPALERSAVMIAEGNVLSPSTRWFWEGTPASMITASLATGLQGMESLAIIWPERNRVRHEGILNGRVEAFEVHRRPHRSMVVRLRLSLWGGRGRELLATFGAGSEVPLSSLTAAAIADSAAKAMVEVNAQVREWLDKNADKILAEQ